MSIGDFLEMLSQQILVGIILVGRLGVRSKLLLEDLHSLAWPQGAA